MTLRSLRRHAVTHSLFEPLPLQGAIDRLGFVQADPIRSPARAQDLILRHRVTGYRSGDLEREYASLDVEEDYLYAYGFVSRRVWELLHPRKTPPLRVFERKVLEVVRALGETHPSELESHLGRRRVVNAWGGYSKATTHALEWLHWRGLLRIVRRDSGVRVYRSTATAASAEPSPDRLRRLVMVYARIFAPSPLKSLHTVLARHRELGSTRETVKSMIDAAALRTESVDGVAYVWPADAEVNRAAPRRVSMLAPFDPVVWDRVRFEHLWGWPYRFEAYTPVKKRIRGYYAMPLLWDDDVIGWANVTGAKGASDALAATVELGFIRKRPRDTEFRHALDAEVARLEVFLKEKGQA